ncbi:hypothetical protein TNCV_1109731 [Trichonephila clavipes]|nr:hypothetical protein TNCV_1109731 [Trichonephila clavipes]
MMIRTMKSSTVTTGVSYTSDFGCPQKEEIQEVVVRGARRPRNRSSTANPPPEKCSIEEPLEKPLIGFKDFVPIALCVDTSLIKDVQWCSTALHDPDLVKDSSSPKLKIFPYLGELVTSPTFPPNEDSSIITRIC